MDDARLIEPIGEEVRETINLTLEVRKETEEIRRIADAAIQRSDAACKKAEAAWKLVVMTP